MIYNQADVKYMTTCGYMNRLLNLISQFRTVEDYKDFVFRKRHT